MSVAGYVKRAAADDAWIRSIPHIYRFMYCYSHMLETVQAYAMCEPSLSFGSPWILRISHLQMLSKQRVIYIFANLHSMYALVRCLLERSHQALFLFVKYSKCNEIL